jgi:hypothetical protein
VYTSGVPGAHSFNTENRTDGTCQDVADQPGIDHALTITKYDAVGCEPIEGTVLTGINAGSYVHNWYEYRGKAISHLSTKTLASTSWANMAARTNPSRPDLTPLSLLQDLYDIPRMLKGVSKLLSHPKSALSAKEIANQNLSIQFGWLPLISDVQKLITTQARVEKRYKRLREMYDTGGVHRKLFVDEDHVESVLNKTFSIFTLPGARNFNCRITKKTEVQRWGTARWNMLARPPEDLTYDRLHRLAYNVANGLTVEGMLQGAWDVLPWTWLLDWFTNVGDFALLHSNTVPAVLVSACQMTKTESETYFDRLPTTNSAFTSGGGTAFSTSKVRLPYTGASLTAGVPGLGLGHVSILGSLFVQRFLR